MDRYMRWLVLIIFSLIALAHFVWLERVPMGMQPDELEFVLSGYTYRHYGVDLAGYGLPMSLFATQTHGVISPVPALMYALLFIFAEPSQLAVRLVPTFLMFGTAYWVYVICTTLFKRRDLGIVAAIVFLVMPWQLHYARYAADTPFALFFMIGAIALLLKDKAKYWGIGLGLLVLGFFSYHGAKLLFAPLVLTCVGYQILKRKRNNQIRQISRQHILVILVGFAFFIIYLTIMFSLKESIVAQRGEQLFFLNTQRMNYEVDYARQRAFPSWINSLMINKVTYGVSVFSANYLTSFAPDVLFAAGDPSSVNRWDVHGLLYRTDAVVLLLGVVWLALRYPRQGLLLAALVAVAPLPSALSNFNASVMHRSFLLVGLLPMVLAGGYMGGYEFLQKLLKTEWMRRGAVGVIGIVLVGQIVYFLHFYLLRFPLLHPGAYYWGERVVAAYLEHGRDNERYFIAHSEPRTVALTFLFYTDAQTRRAYLRPGDFPEGASELRFGKYEFKAGCSEDETVTQLIAHDFGHCRDREGEFVQILSPKDGGSYYRVYGDRLCDGVELDSFTFPYKIDDLNFYPTDRNRFCQRWVSE